MSASFPLYHWSPSERRKGIARRGLVPGSLSTDRAWRPPYVAFADSPSWAWALSADFRPEIESWDLWTVWSDRLQGWEELPDQHGGVQEYRVYHRVFKRDLWFVGTRLQAGERAVVAHAP